MRREVPAEYPDPQAARRNAYYAWQQIIAGQPLKSFINEILMQHPQKENLKKYEKRIIFYSLLPIIITYTLFVLFVLGASHYIKSITLRLSCLLSPYAGT